MKFRVTASTLAALFWAAGLFGQVSGGPELTATGQLVSTGDMSLVLKADDGTEHGPFIVTTTTQLSGRLADGTRVTIFYHPVGDRQVADRIVPASASVRPAAPETGPSADRPSGQGGPHMEFTAYEPGAPRDLPGRRQ
jgi:hypothetical protein